jgi:HNH endonuclease
MIAPDQLARLVAKIARRSVRDENGCLIWAGAKTPKGYGVVSDGPSLFYVHRVAYEAANAPPSPLLVCHRCDTPSCAEAAHLFAGTAAQNSADMVSKGRNQRGETAPNAVLTLDAVRDIRSNSAPLKVMAAKYGVAPGTISHVRRRTTWAHV